MCAINPVYKKRFIIDVYTSDRRMSEEDFNSKACLALLQSELTLNTDFPQLRFHLKETEQQAE